MIIHVSICLKFKGEEQRGGVRKTIEKESQDVLIVFIGRNLRFEIILEGK